MEKVFEKSTKDQLNPHKGLKFLSALGMVLPVFMGSVQSVFADGHHYIQVDNIPGAVPIEQNSFGGRQGQIASVYCVHGGFWDDRHQGIHGKVDGKEMRFYCLEPEKVTPGQGSTSKYKKQQAKVGVKKVLMVGFGANSAEEMGFNGYSSEAEYATQVAVWLAQGAITSNIRWANTASGRKAHEIFDYIQKEVGKIKGNGATTLTLKATNVDKKAGTATLTPRLVENSENISREGTIRLTNMTATQDGKSVTSKIDSNKAIQVKGTGSSGSVKVTFPARTLAAPMYNAQYNNSQDTVSLVSLPAKSVSKTWSFDTPDTPPDKPQKKIKAMFDLKKKDDEGDQVDQAKFDVYTADAGYSPDEFIGTITTNKNGVARSGELDPGYYVAIERSTGKNLDIDQTPVQIDLTAENLEQNAKVTHVKNPDGSEYDLYHLDVDGPINNHKKPQITSLLTNLEDNSKFAQPIKGPVTLNEHLYFSHLVGTVSYNVHAWLVDKATGQPITINGQKIEATKTIGSRNNDTNDDGIEDQTDLQLKIPDASSLAGKDIVAFSEISRSDKPDHWTSVHQDINDKQETIHFSKPSIHTNAINKETQGKKLQPTDGETITDTVTYKELIPGKEYTLKGIVMDKETGKAVMNNGQKVEFTKKFTATDANGRVDAEVTFDAHHYRNHRLVVFESLYYTDYLLTDHRDINDVDQSLDVTNPQLHTTLSDNTQKLVSPKAENTVEDVIRYTDLIPGQTYSVRGKLMDQVTGSPVMKRGVPVMATATFKPNMPNGTVTLTFVFDGTQYVGHHITAFESLYTNGRIVVEHADLNDASQTVSVDNKHDNVIPIIPTPIIPGPTPGTGGTIINNNNNNNNNNNSSNNNGNNNNGNNGNNSSNNGSNNSGNNGNNGSNNSGNNGNNGSNNSGNNGNNGSNNSGNNGSHNNGSHNNGNNGSHNNGRVARTHTVATKSVLPTNKMIVAPATTGATTVSVAAPTKSGHTVVSKEVLPAQSPSASSSESLPQTGAKGNPKAQALGAVAVVVSIGSYVYFSRRKQTTGLD